MKSQLKLVLIAITGSLLFTSCGSDNKAGKLIPKDAAMAIHVNTESLGSKLSWAEIKNTSYFKEAYADTTVKPWMKKLMDDPANSGMNLENDLVMFLQVNTKGPGNFVMTGDVKDVKAFEAFNKNLEPSATVTKDGKINFVAITDEAVVGWNDDQFMYVVNVPATAPNSWDMGSDSMAPAPAANSSSRLIDVCKRTFALKGDSSLSKEEKFSDLLDEDGDIHFWQNNEELTKSSMSMSMLSMMKLDKLLKGNISTYTLNFADGQIALKQNMYAGKELSDLMKKYSGSKLDTDMLKNIPSKNVAGVLSMSFKPEGLHELIKLTGVDGLINMFLAQQGFTLEDFIKANKGDVMLAVSDLNIYKDTTSFDFTDTLAPSRKKPRQVDMLFAFSIGDKVAFDKLLNVAKKIGNEMPSDEIFSQGNDKYFAIGNNPDGIKSYIAGGNNSHAFLDKLKGHPFGAYFNLQYIMNSFKSQMASDTTGSFVLAESIKFWDNVYMTGGDYDDGALHSLTEVNLMDKKSNSLKQLNGYIDRIAKVMIEENKKNKARWDNSTTDTTTILTMPDSTVTQ